MQEDERKKKIWFLAFEEDGRPRIRWRMVGLIFPAILIGQTAVLFLMTRLVGINPNAFSPSYILMISIPLIGMFVLMFSITYDREVARYRGETPGYQFGLRTIFLLTLTVCAWLASAMIEIERNSIRFELRENFVAELSELVPQGKVRYSGGTNELQVVIESPEFDDNDFRMLVEKLAESPDGAYIYYLSLFGTSITDQSLTLMSDWHGLQYLFLSRYEDFRPRYAKPRVATKTAATHRGQYVGFRQLSGGVSQEAPEHQFVTVQLTTPPPVGSTACLVSNVSRPVPLPQGFLESAAFHRFFDEKSAESWN